MGFNQIIKYSITSMIFTICGILVVRCDQEWCKNPIVNSIDRFNNNTLRLFRDNDYWDLIEFNGEKAKFGGKGSMKGYEFFNPVDKSSRIVTVLSGSPVLLDRTFKFKGTFWWSWFVDPKFGVRTVATEMGLYWNEIPKQHGFDAVFHNADKADPMLIGLQSDPKFSDKNMKIHYFSTQKDIFIRKTSNFYDQNDFPKDMTDAFAMTPTDGLKYMVFILNVDKYCILTDKQKCSQWKSLSQMIDCSTNLTPIPEKIPETDDSGQQQSTNRSPDEDVVGGDNSDGRPPDSAVTSIEGIDAKATVHQSQRPDQKDNENTISKGPIKSVEAANEQNKNNGSTLQKIGLSLILFCLLFVIYIEL